MKTIYTIAILALLVNSKGYTQTVLPLETTEFCPNTEQTFTVTLPTGSTYSAMSAIGGCTITQLPPNGSGASFSFNGRFADLNQTQIFKVDFANNGPQVKQFIFKRIKSLRFPSSCLPILPNQTNVQPAICSAVNIPISFTNIPWSNSFEGLCFGAINTYEYQLPVGWKIGATYTSTGSDWYSGGNNVTVTSNLLGGNGSVIAIRPTNSCSSGLLNNSTPVYVNITRPNAPVLKLNGASSVTLYCGDASAKNFTVLNPASCVTSYEWVTANKGWFDANGVAITANIITTTPSLTIYPSCAGSNPAKDIEVLMKSVTEVLSSKVTVTFSSAAPPLAITGAPEFCTSSTYTVPFSTACGASVSWSLQPLDNYPFPVTLSCTNCSSTNLTILNGGTALLRATVTFPNCNSTGIYEKYIGVGVPQFRGWYNSPTNSLQPLNPWTRQNLDATNEVCYGTYITTVTDITANASVTWADAGNSGGVTWNQIGNNLRFYFSDINQWAFFSVTITNSCGTKNLRYRFNSTGATTCGGPLLRVSVSPNPSTNLVNVTLTEKEDLKNKKEIKQIKIVDKTGNVKQIKNFKSLLDANVDVANLPVDVYTIFVFDGKQWYTTKFIKN